MSSEMFLLVLSEDQYIESTMVITPSANLVLPPAIAVQEQRFRDIEAGLNDGIIYRFVDGDIIEVDPDVSKLRKEALAKINGVAFDSGDFRFNDLGTSFVLSIKELPYLAMAGAAKVPYTTSCGVILGPEHVVRLCGDIVQRRNAYTKSVLSYTRLINNAKNQRDVQKHVTNFQSELSKLLC